MRKVPIIPTVIVVAAVVTMIALGFWQLDRKAEKEALLARYQQASTLSSAVEWPQTEAETEAALFRHAQLDCERVLSLTSRAGTSVEGRKGWAHVARCAIGGGREADVAIGWSERPEAPDWQGGVIEGIVAPGPRLVAGRPTAGLAPLAPPDPADVPNNHLAYAGQWFFFALTALVIYMLALRQKWRAAA
ncbi:SURF1 family protein [Pelagerythrobacter aerophilus]|uniref:SURF1-like protein n=1 Tax=Pelagerythrobacter aerophilus TaxID=2306995 RepID=A0A418NKI4_9SPHN|nr:SURF1 family protein [Pelagerythrobacter aerophilus]RIV79803.1 SURF1 family protein [Pelagerythrobacter aerophilus]